ncbi:MAG: hypothetical protein ABSG74_14240 [Candidatus Bathyarchaeia archaeon]|jgi:hypothetical protein
MAQNLTKVIFVVVFLLAGILAAAQVQAAETAAASAPAASEVGDWFHNPEPWFEEGADFRFREHYGYNWKKLNSDLKYKGEFDDTFQFERYRTRWWTTTKLDENNAINTRLTWEFRTWNKPPDQEQDTDFDEIIIDNLNYKGKNFLGLPVTATLGRQDIQDLGQGWLVFDGTPLDGSRTFYFDALRFTWDLGEKTKLDTIYVRNMPNSDWWLKPINDRDKYVTQEEEQGAIVYLTDKSNKDMQREAYFMYKNNNPVNPNVGNAFNFPQAAVNAYSKKAEVYTFGGAISGPVINDNWNYRVEGAVQTGKSESPNAALTPNHKTEDLMAFGEKSTLEYSFKDDLDNKLHVTYEYLSGDDPGSKTVTAFNPLWGQWPQWSEMYQPYTTQLEDNLVSNLHRLDFGHKFKPNSQWEILTDWNFLWSDENTYKGNAKFSDSGNFRGNLITCWARYAFSKQLSGNLVGEYMMPGNYYSKANNDDALYFHFTVTYTF